MSRKQLIIQLFCACLVLLGVLSTNIQQAEAQATGGLNPLANTLEGIILDVTQDVYFPDLTGPYQVGRASYHLVDQNRNDIYQIEDLTLEGWYELLATGEVIKPREFMVWVHYPAEPGAQPAPYLQDPLRFYMAQALAVGGNPAEFDLIHSHASVGTEVAGDPSISYPVLVFSHGKNIHPLFYTAMLEELASQGYIVVSIAHPHDATVSVLSDGRVLIPPQGNENPLVELAAADPPVVPGTLEAIEALTMYEITSRPGDVLFTLSKLFELNLFGPLAGRLDLNNVALFGHSFGAGTTAWALQASGQLPGLKAALILDTDGVPLVLQEGTPALTQAVMFMNGSGVDCESDRFPPTYCSDLYLANCMNIGYLMQTDPFYFFELDTSTHLSYVSDLVLAEPFLADFDPYFGIPIIDIDNERAVEVINDYAVALFNKHLKGQDNGLLDGFSCDYPEVWFENQPLINPICPPEPPTPTPDPSTIPEPGTFFLVGLGLLGILTLVRKKRRK
jgi:hypothetical protein